MLSPALSVAVHDTGVVVATANWLPEAGEQTTLLRPEPSGAVGAANDTVPNG